MAKNIKIRTVAIIEDDEILANTLGDELQDAGYKVIKALNGNQGLTLVLKEHPDLILLDIVMPEMDGITMLNELRMDIWGKAVPVIILTNLSEASKVAKAFVKGAFDYLVKSSWRLEDVVEKVDRKLKR